jgi:phosphomannomutase/phosphoglucomutase
MKSLAKLLGNPSIALLVILLSCSSILAGFLWQHQHVTSQQLQSDLSKQKHIAEMIHAAVEGKVNLFYQQMALIAQSPQLETIFLWRDPRLVASQQRALARLFPAVKKACLIAANVDEPDPDACIPISFATLNSLRQAKKEGSAPIAVMQAGTPDSYLLMTQSIKNNQDKVVGVLAMTVDTQTVNQLIPVQFGSEGYVELQQGAIGGAALTMQGNKQWRQGLPLYQKKVAKSHWHIAYWPAVQAQTNSYLLIAGIVLSLVLLMWLFRERSQRFVLNHDIGMLRHQLRDLSTSQLKANYPMVNPEMDVVADDIQALAQTRPISKKVKSTTATEEPLQALSEPDTVLEFGEPVLRMPKDDAPSKVDEPTLRLDDAPLELKIEAQPTIELAPSIFKAYDIRGIVGETIDEHTFRTIGQAIGSEALDQEQARLVVGRDGRLSSESLSAALIEGIIASGCEVVDIGQVPTPVLYFACEHLHTASGVMVTGSHNPANYNGLKIVIADKPIFGAKLQQLYQRILQGNVHSGQGSHNNADLIEDYIAQVMSGIHLTRPLKVVVDCGNGVGGLVVPQLLSAMGCEVIELYCEVDGNFPNHHPNPSEPSNLQDLILAVQRSGAELGLAFDGDGDRLGVVDTEGNIIWSDRLLMMFAQDVLSRLPGALVIYDVKCSSLLEDVILSAGGEALMTVSGYALLRDKMQETGAPLAGEMSGHIFFNDRWFGFDDALYSACRLLELLARDPLERSATEVFSAIPNRENTPEMMVEMDEVESQEFIRQFTAEANFPGAKVVTIDGVRADYPTGWGLVRASNTVPGLVLRFEADTQENLQEIQQQFKQQMLQVKPTITLLF